MNVLLEYGPCILSMAKIQRMPLVRINRREAFQKGTGRNRMTIAGSQGASLLSIPILGGRSHHQTYGETPIDHRLPWRRRHFGALRSNYGKAPYWEHYADGLAELYNKEYQWLFDWNLYVLRYLLAWLAPNTSITETDEPAQSRFDEKQTARQPTPTPLPYYHQVFAEKTGFLPNLSVLDLLLNVGHPQARQYLENTAAHCL